MQLEIEDNFHLKNRTVNHTPPNLMRTLHLLHKYMSMCKIHKEINNRKVHYLIPDKQSKGLWILVRSLDLDLTSPDLDEDGEDEVIVQAEDLID